MSDKVKLTYKDRVLKVTLGKKELPLNKLVDPAVILLSADKPPTLRFEMIIDGMEIDDVKALGEWVTHKELLDDPNN